MRFSIRSQLLLPLLALMLAVVATSTWTALTAASRARRQIETQMDHVTATVRDVTFPRNQQTLQLMKRLSGAEFILCDSRGKPLLDDQDRPIATLSEVPDRLPEGDNVDGHPLGGRVTVQGNVYFAHGVPLGEHVSANRRLYVLYAESLWHDALWQALRPALFLGILGGVISMVLTVLVTQRLTRRIQALERRTRIIAGGDFSPMPLSHRDDELRDLGQSINDMAERLAVYQEAAGKAERLRLLGQVSGGLAHQLRNGITGARLAVQLHARACAQGDAESLTVALRQLSLVETNLKRFLDVGKAVELRRQRCDLRDVVREAVAFLGPQSRHAGIALCHEGAGHPVIISADVGQLDHVFHNVLTNALEACGPGGRVDVTLGSAVDNAFVEIVDSGPGPTPEVAKRLFEPFVTDKPEGVGLGLAVARQVAEAHSGSIEWFRKPKGTCFRVQLPMESEKGALS
jgi:signal transduction histidine kinase